MSVWQEAEMHIVFFQKWEQNEIRDDTTYIAIDVVQNKYTMQTRKVSKKKHRSFAST
jgi:hypothetical protein